MTTLHLIVDETTRKPFGLYVNGSLRRQEKRPLRLTEIMAEIDTQIHKIYVDAEDMQTITVLPENIGDIPITNILAEDGTKLELPTPGGGTE